MPESSGSDPEGPLDRRRLIAIVYADMVGYSRLIGLDDAGTIQRLKALRNNLIDPAIEEHGGKLVQTGGDSLLIVFDSIDGAVRCAVKVQQQVPNHDAGQPDDLAIRFRVGINLGDAIADGTDLHGDAVNIAARLQAVCPPGGICVSRSVRDHAHGRLGLEFEELGALNLKNIAHPVEAFMLRRATAAHALQSVERSLVDGAGMLPLPDKPSIAILPFANLSADLEQEYFSDGVADDIITELSRSRSLFVIARNSSFAYKGSAIDVKRVGRELGVRYILEGSVRRGGGLVRVNAQLIDAETGRHIWADRYDCSLADVFAVQDEITDAVTAAILPAVTDAEQQRALRKPPENLGAWEAYQRGLWHLGRCSATDAITAQQFFERSIALDPGFAPAHTAMSRAITFRSGVSGDLAFDEAIRLVGEHVRDAVAIDPSDPDAQAAVARWRHARGQSQQALEGLSSTLAGNPNSTWANGIKGVILVTLGHRSEGRGALLTALRLNPRDPSVGLFPTWIAISYYYDCDYGRVVTLANMVIERYPDYAVVYPWLAAAFGQLGRYDKAREALQHATEASPKSFDLNVRHRPPWQRSGDHEHMLDGLRKAGWHG
jgi:adenylate cyclase